MNKYFYRTIRLKKWLFALFITVSLLNQLVIIIYPLFLNYILNYFSQIQTCQIILFVILSLLLPLMNYGVDALNNYISNKFSTIISASILEEIFHKNIVKLKKFSVDEINRTVNNFSGLLCSFYLFNVLGCMFNLMSALVMSIILVKESVFLALGIILLNIVRLVFVYCFKSKLKKVSQDKLEAENKYMGYVVKCIQKLKTIRLRKQEEQVLNQLEDLENYFYLKNNQAVDVNSTISMINQNAVWLIKFATIILGLMLFYQMQMNILVLPLAFMYAQNITQSFDYLSYLSSSYASLKGFYNGVLKILSIEKIKDNGLQNSFDTLTLKEVGFVFDDFNIFTCLNYTFKKGLIYVITGENGTGKSTLFKLLSGLYPRYQGQILLNQHCLSDYNIEYYQYNLISTFLQEDFLFEGTILDNLFTTQKEQAILLCHQFGLDENKKVENNGKNLSGGQKRKVLFIRFLLEVKAHQPSLILLDEPTYALDAQSIEVVKQTIQDLSKQHLVILISHDILNSEGNFKVLKLENGGLFNR